MSYTDEKIDKELESDEWRQEVLDRLSAIEERLKKPMEKALEEGQQNWVNCVPGDEDGS